MPFAVEVVVRGYMTGSTSTSLWTHYSRGERNYCGNAFPDGLRKNDRLPENVITPTTKASVSNSPLRMAGRRGSDPRPAWRDSPASSLCSPRTTTCPSRRKRFCQGAS